MKDVFIGSTIAIIVSLIFASYVGNRMISPDQSPPIIPVDLGH